MAMSDNHAGKHRALRSTVATALAGFPAVLLVGARQVGKSTLAAQLVAEGSLAASVTLDDFSTLAAAQTDAQGFVAGLAHGTAIDEVQRAPDLLRAAKLVIDRDRRCGRFLLTGSANVLALPATTESLAGRAALLELEGFSLAEAAGREPPLQLFELLFGHGSWSSAVERLRAMVSPLSATEQRQAIFFGGFPEVVLRATTAFHETWFSSYLALYVERDVRDLARIPDTAAFGTLFRLAASASGQLANMAQLGSDAKVDQRTAAHYVRLLEITFQLNRLQPWFRNVRKRLVKTPKLYLRDTGLACHMLGITAPDQLVGHPAAGALWETWVYGELRKLAGLGPRVDLSFVRTHTGNEVDFVLQRGDVMAAIEVKAGHSVAAEDFGGIRELRELVGKDLRGIVLYGGHETVSFGDGLAAVPFGVLRGKRGRKRLARRSTAKR